MLETLDRTLDIRVSSIPNSTKGRNMSLTEGIFDKSGWCSATVGLFNECLLKVSGVLYKKDTLYINLDNITNRVLIPLPWGSTGYKNYGIRANECDVFRRIMIAKSLSKRKRPLFDYSEVNRSWYFNVLDYPTIEEGFRYLKINEVTVSDYLLHYKAYKLYRNQQADKFRKKHGKL